MHDAKVLTAPFGATAAGTAATFVIISTRRTFVPSVVTRMWLSSTARFIQPASKCHFLYTSSSFTRSSATSRIAFCVRMYSFNTRA